MKRSEALISLSRDHHKALVVAKSLREAVDAKVAAEIFLGYWEEHGRIHFRIEEEVMLPVWAFIANDSEINGEIDREQVTRMLDEHLRIRREALRIRAGDATLDQIRELGRLLAEHVRFEERELFATIEATLSETALSDLAEAVESAER